MRKNLRDIVALIRFIAARFVQDRCAETAASLTFTTLLSLVPMVTIALTVFSAFPVFENFSAQIKMYLLNNLMPEKAGVVITQYMQQFADSGEAEDLGNVLMFRAAFDFVSRYLLSSRKSTITKQIRSEYHFLRLVGLAFLNRFSHKAAADDEDTGPWNCLRPAVVVGGNNQPCIADLQPVNGNRRR